MAADFTTLVTRLDTVRQTLVATLRTKGVDAAADDSLTVLVGKASLVDSTSGMNQIRNGYQLFRNNTTMVAFPEFDTASFDSMYQMCYGCSALERVPTLDTSLVGNMMYIFYECTNLVEIGGLDTSLITSASEMFHGCKNLQRIGGTLDFSNVQSQMDSTFVSCAALEDVTFTGRINVDIAVNGCSALSTTSLLSLLNALSPDISGKECRLGSRNLAKLSAEQQAIATDKGWILA